MKEDQSARIQRLEIIKLGVLLKNDSKGFFGDQYTEDCIKFTCIKANKKIGVWSQGPAM